MSQAVEEGRRPVHLGVIEQLLEKVNGVPYAHVMVIDGNDDRGIDVGVMTRAGYEITSIRSHVDDEDQVGTIFSRDCPEYAITTPTGARLVNLVNHLKSKGFGLTDDSNKKRKRQANQVKKIYERLIASGEQNIVVLGDFNDTPDSAQLRPLLKQTDLKDISTQPGVHERRPAGHVQERHQEREDRLPAHLASTLRQCDWGRSLPHRCLGWQERHSLADLQHDDQDDPRGQRPRRGLRRHQHLTRRTWRGPRGGLLT
jgi:endonuclease/exonuclease/phosphatase family metal-dependent hydrolase